MKRHIELKDLKVYKKALKISDKGWSIYKSFNWQTKKIIGDQLIRAIDSIGANIAEGYGRYHYLDRTKFYYNARGSLLEVLHWVALLEKRGLVNKTACENIVGKLNSLNYSLNVYIKSVYRAKNAVS